MRECAPLSPGGWNWRVTCRVEESVTIPAFFVTQSVPSHQKVSIVELAMLHLLVITGVYNAFWVRLSEMRVHQNINLLMFA